MFVCSFTVCTHNFWRQCRHSFLFISSYLPCASPSLHRKTSPKWPTLYFFKLHLWRHPGRAKMLCMHTKMIHKYTTSDGWCDFLFFNVFRGIKIMEHSNKLFHLQSLYKVEGCNREVFSWPSLKVEVYLKFLRRCFNRTLSIHDNRHNLADYQLATLWRSSHKKVGRYEL